MPNKSAENQRRKAMELTFKPKAAFGVGAVGKNMVYALAASYAMYFYQDVLGISAAFVGSVLMITRIFDVVNDPFMGILGGDSEREGFRLVALAVAAVFIVSEVICCIFLRRSPGQKCRQRALRICSPPFFGTIRQ